MRGHMLPVALSADPPVRSYCAAATLALPCVLILVLSPLRPVPARRRMHAGRSGSCLLRPVGALLTSIPGAVIELRLPQAGWSAWRESEPQAAAVPPGDRDLEVGEAGIDEDGGVAAQGHRAGGAVSGGGHGGGGRPGGRARLCGGGG